MEHLPAELRSQIASLRAPYILNYKIVLELTEASWGFCMKMKEAINNIIEAKSIKAMDTDLNIRCIVAPAGARGSPRLSAALERWS